MNKSLISVGAALSAIGVIVVAPAQAGTLTFDFDLSTSSQITFNSVLSGMSLSGVTIPDSLQVTANDVTGSFTVLDDPAQFTDGSLDLDYDLLDDALLSSTYSAMLESLLGDYDLTASGAVTSVDALFNISQFTGSGELESKDFTLANDTTAFDISYDNSTNVVTLSGYDTDVAESCLSTTCVIDDVNLSFDVSLVLSEFITVTNELLTNSDISLSPETSDTIASLQQTAAFAQLFSPTLNLATVEVERFSAITSLDSSDPTGTALDSEVSSGIVTVTTTTDGQTEEIFSESLGSPWDSAESATVVTQPADVSSPNTEVTVPTKAPLPTLVKPPIVIANTPISTPISTPASSPGGSVTITSSKAPITLINNAPESSSDAVAVPEPSVVLGLLGTAALVKRRRKQ